MTAAMVAGVVSPVAAAGKTFPDVDGHWSKESVYYLVEKALSQVMTMVHSLLIVKSLVQKQLQ